MEKEWEGNFRHKITFTLAPCAHRSNNLSCWWWKLGRCKKFWSWKRRSSFDDYHFLMYMPIHMHFLLLTSGHYWSQSGLLSYLFKWISWVEHVHFLLKAGLPHLRSNWYQLAVDRSLDWCIHGLGFSYYRYHNNFSSSELSGGKKTSFKT